MWSQNLLAGDFMNSLLIIFLLIVLVIAALIDVRVRKIPNLLTYQTMVVALSYHCLRNGLEIKGHPILPLSRKK